MQVGEVLGAVAVADAVEARQVRRRLGRRDQVVDRDRELGARQLDVDEGGAEARELVERGATAAARRRRASAAGKNSFGRPMRKP